MFWSIGTVLIPEQNNNHKVEPTWWNNFHFAMSHSMQWLHNQNESALHVLNELQNTYGYCVSSLLAFLDRCCYCWMNEEMNCCNWSLKSDKPAYSRHIFLQHFSSNPPSPSSSSSHCSHIEYSPTIIMWPFLRGQQNTAAPIDVELENMSKSMSTNESEAETVNDRVETVAGPLRYDPVLPASS